MDIQREGDPWVVGDQRPIQQLNGLADNDPAMRKMAAHPRIVSVLQTLLSPDVHALSSYREFLLKWPHFLQEIALKRCHFKKFATYTRTA